MVGERRPSGGVAEAAHRLRRRSHGTTERRSLHRHSGMPELLPATD